MFVLPFVPSPIASPLAGEAGQRLRRDEEVLDAPEELRQPVVEVGGAQEEQVQERLAFVHVVDLARQSRAMVFAWWKPCTSGLIARQMEELEESFAAGPALQLSLFQDTSDWPPFVLLCRAADVQRSGPGPGSETHDAVQRWTLCACVLFLVYICYHKTSVASDAAAAGGAG